MQKAMSIEYQFWKTQWLKLQKAKDKLGRVPMIGELETLTTTERESAKQAIEVIDSQANLLEYLFDCAKNRYRDQHP